MAFSTDGLRQNVKMSDMIKYFSLSNSPTATVGGLLSMSEVFGVPMFAGRSGFTDVGGLYNSYNEHSALRSVNGTSTTNSQRYAVWSHVKGRYRASSTGTPSNQTIPQVQLDVTSGKGTATNLKFSDLVGYSDAFLTNDACGQTRGVKAGYTTNTSSLGNPAVIRIQNQSGQSDGRKPGFSNYGTASFNEFGYSVYSTYHNNSWTELGLNTVMQAGDRVVVIAHAAAGGTMNTFTTTDPIYLRTQTGASVSGVSVGTLMNPHKNETGSDDWMAIYTATATSGGAARVGVNPYHSSTVFYNFHVIVFKGPSVTVSCSNQFTKYTQPDNSPVYNSLGVQNFGPTNWSNGHSRQAIAMGISCSPFGSPYSFVTNGFNTNLTGNLGVANGVDMDIQSCTGSGVGVTTGGRGAYYVSFCHFTGGMIGSTSYDGKYGAINYNFGPKSYTPQIARKMPIQDGRYVYLLGWRE